MLFEGLSIVGVHFRWCCSPPIGLYSVTSPIMLRWNDAVSRLMMGWDVSSDPFWFWGCSSRVFILDFLQRSCCPYLLHTRQTCAPPNLLVCWSEDGSNGGILMLSVARFESPNAPIRTSWSVDRRMAAMGAFWCSRSQDLKAQMPQFEPLGLCPNLPI
jgi:hypothetical protein